jgi:SAM-dependent methyltransferase
MAFCCPRCHGSLAQAAIELLCEACGSVYPIRFGLPDFRLGAVRDVDAAEDLRIAEVLAAREPHATFAALRDYYYSLSPEASAQLHERHEAHFNAEPQRATAALARFDGPGAILDLGCGAGSYLRAAARRGRSTVGIDASLCQLILARRLLADESLTVELAAAEVERLPLAAESFSLVLATDLIEHVEQQTSALAEAARVLEPSGAMWVTTPNRYSLTSEPHVGLWGLGWLPRGLALRYAQLRTGIDYTSIRLLSLVGLSKLLRQNFADQFVIQLPIPSGKDLLAFSAAKRSLAHVYIGVAKIPALRGPLLAVAPYFEATCRKRSRAE